MEYTALYRQWRPAGFDEVVGQEAIVHTLKNQIKNGRIAHAYLFSGPRGTGKTSIAKIFARAVNCASPIDGNPCDKCSVCMQLSSSNNMDIIEIDAASNNGVDEIRDLRDKVKFPPVAGRFKVYIIDEVHMLSMGAFNALLKTLEEPPLHVIFILATTEPHKLPSTIISRCQCYDFKRITQNVIVKRLDTIAKQMGVKAQPVALYTIARWAQGGMRDALSLLDQCIGFCGNNISNEDVLSVLGTADQGFIFSMVDNMIDSKISDLLLKINSLIEDGKDISVFLKDIIYHVRDLLIVKVCASPMDLLDADDAALQEYRKQAERSSQERLIRTMDILTALEADLKWSSQPRVLLELAMVKICSPQQDDSYYALLERVKALENGFVNSGAKSYDAPANNRDIAINEQDTLNSGYKMKTNAAKEQGTAAKNATDSDLKSSDVNTHDDNDVSLNNKKTTAQYKDSGADSYNKGDKQVEDKCKDIAEAWPVILKTIKKERMAIYSMLGSAQIKQINKTKAALMFPEDGGFYVYAIDKEENRTFIEDIIFKVTGQRIKVVCKLLGQVDNDIDNDGQGEQENNEEDYVVTKAYELFGEDLVEVVEDESQS